MTFKRFISASALAFAVLGASACGGSSDSTDTTPATDAAPVATESEATTPPGDSTAEDASGGAAVGIAQSRFDPTELAVSVGDTVTFTNTDPFDHTVTAKDDSALQFDSGKFGQDATFDVEFTDAGTFNYFCQIHPTMRATVIVS